MKTTTLKNLILAVLLFITLRQQAQSRAWVPNHVEEIIMSHAQNHKTGLDTIRWDNYVYIVNIQHLGLDTLNYIYDLVKKNKLYTDYWKAAGVTYFGIAMGSMFVLPIILPEDKNLHFAAGTAIGGIATWCAWRYTKIGVLNHDRRHGSDSWKVKLTCFGVGVGVGTAVGLGKEYIWDKKTGGTVSLKDAAFTSIGAVFGSLGAVIVIGKKTAGEHRNYKHYIQP